MSNVGVIGVGLLGSAITERLLEKGRDVYAFDANPSQVDRVAELGAVASDSASEVMRRCDDVILSLPTSDIVRQVLLASEADVREGQAFIDTTTGAPEDAVSTEAWLKDRGASYVEANVAGSSVQQRVGEATLLLGGEAATIDALKGVLDDLSSRHFHLGPVGAASRFKLVHNLILGLHRAVLAEGLTFAESLGFDAEVALQVLRETPAASTVMQTKGKQMATGQYPLQARLAQHLKDVGLILDTANSSGAYTPLSQIHETLLQQAQALGLSDSDNSAIIEVFRNARTQSFE